MITGGSGGIGASMAKEAARRGAGRIILLSRNEEGMKEVKVKIEKDMQLKGGVEVVVCDLVNGEDRGRKVREVLGRGNVDVLVNNAGCSQRGTFQETGTSVVRGMFELNFFAGVEVLEMCLPGMREGKGKVVWISSVQGVLALPGRAGYSGSKHAVDGFCRSLR